MSRVFIIGGLRTPIGKTGGTESTSLEPRKQYNSKDYRRKNLEKHSCPQKIKFVNIIPLNSSGKADKVKLLSGSKKTS